MRVNVEIAKPIRDYVDALVHARARSDSLTTARHRAFIAAKLIAGVTALAALPALIGLRGVPDALETLLFAWFALQVLLVAHVSHTGRYGRAQMFSVLALAMLGLALGVATGGLGAAAAIWLLIVPLEAALLGTERFVVPAGGIAIAAAALLLLVQFNELLPAALPASAALANVSLAAAALYVAALTFGASTLARATVSLLRAEQDRRRVLAEAISDGITRHDAKGAVLYASRTAENIFGVPAQDLLGQGLYERVHEADRPAYLLALADAATSRRSRALELRIHRDLPGSADPQCAWVEMQCRPVEHMTARAAAGEVIAVTRDISARKAAAEAAQAARAELVRVGEAHDRVLAILGHELRAPLNAIIGFSHVLAQEQRDGPNDTRWRSYARLINQSGSHMLEVIEATLARADSGDGEFIIAAKSFLPAPIIRECCDMLSLDLRRAGLDLELRFAGALPEVFADQRAFRQILINLISNAVQYTDRGGRITIAAHVDESALVVSIEDSGIGIEREDLARLTEPRFRARPAIERRSAGAGLGLAVVKNLVERQGGALEFASRVGQGTRVSVRLPLAPAIGRAGAPVTRLNLRAQPDVREKKRA